MPKLVSPDLGNSLIAQFILQTLRAHTKRKHPSDVSEEQREREEATVHVTNHAMLRLRGMPLPGPYSDQLGPQMKLPFCCLDNFLFKHKIVHCFCI